MFERVLERAVRRLSKAKTKKLVEDFALIGGHAVSRWGIPRATVDVDFFISVGDADLYDLSKFVDGELRKGSINDPLLATITFEEQDDLGAIPIQLLHFPPAWEDVAKEDITSETSGGVRIPIVGWKALVLLKLYAGGTIDLDDARNVLTVVAPSSRAIKDLEKRARALRVSKRLNRVLGKT